MPLIREGAGWVACTIFASPSFCIGPRSLRVLQAGAALVWILYGVLIGSLPVIVSNINVSSLAAYSA